MASGIYKIYRKDKPEQAYIGSSNDIDRRWYDHKWHLSKNKHHCSRLQNIFNKHGDILVFSILEECPSASLLELEQHYIDEHIKTHGKSNTLNTAKKVQRSMDDPEIRKLIVDGIRNKWATDKEFADKKKAFIAGFTKDPEINKRRLEARSKSYKKVKCLELGLEFSSAREASEYLKTLGVSVVPSTISACCRRERKSSGGYNWRYAGDEDLSINKPHKKRKVVMVETGLLFDSTAEAARYITKLRGVKSYGYPISACCLGNLKSAYGYVWRTQ